MGKQCLSQAVLELGSRGHSVLQTPALVCCFFFFLFFVHCLTKCSCIPKVLYLKGYDDSAGWLFVVKPLRLFFCRDEAHVVQ